MASIVLELQQNILGSEKGVTEILRTAKVISAELGLDDITTWIERELNGYGEIPVPNYRRIHGGSLQLHNPYQGGWQFAGHVNTFFPIGQAVAGIEDLLKGEQIVLTTTKKYRISGDSFGAQMPQQVVISNSDVKQVLEAIKDQVLNWTIELKKRGITGENISFSESEKQSAKKEPFVLQQNITVNGNWNQSTVQVYNYGSIYQTLKSAGVSKAERDELEAIMEEMEKAEPDKKPSLIQRGKDWIVKNEKFLGASASIIRKALGLGEEAPQD